MALQVEGLSEPPTYSISALCSLPWRLRAQVQSAIWRTTSLHQRPLDFLSKMLLLTDYKASLQSPKVATADSSDCDPKKPPTPPKNRKSQQQQLPVHTS